MVPERITYAVEKLAVQPDERILEIGCGRGVAAELICARLKGGTMVAIDRSAVAIEAARKRNAEALTGGRLILHQVSLDELPDDIGPFDKVFAINVNLFWTGPATAELDLIRRLLKPDGTLHLFYEPPSPSQAVHLSATLHDHLILSNYQPNLIADRLVFAVARVRSSNKDSMY